MDAERLEFLFGADASEVVDDYDLDDEADRMELVERYLPLPPGSRLRDARMAVRTVAVTQILQDDPPETWRTAQRLRDAGIDRDGVFTQLTMVIGEHLSLALSSDSPFDVDEYTKALAELPLPTAGDVARVLIETARDRPGIAAGEHIDATVAALTSRPSQTIETMVDHVLEDLVAGPLHWLPGDLTTVVPDIVADATFTHRLTDAELELGVLSAGFDLGAFGRFERLRLPGGEEIEQFSVEHGHLGWRGPDGWLDEFRAGDLLVTRVTVTEHFSDTDTDMDTDTDTVTETGSDVGVLTEAIVTIETLAHEPAVTDRVVAAVRAAYDEQVAEPGLPVSGDDIALWLCFHHPELVAEPQPALAELCAAAGLEQRGGLVAHDESVWRADLFRRRFRDVADMVPEPEWRRVLGRALDVLDDPESAVDEVCAVLDECAEPETVDVLADVLFPHRLELSDEFERDGVDAPGRLFDLVNRATAVARRSREKATAEYLACVLYERCGAPEIAEAHLQRAVDARPRLGPLVERMGWYRFDRGDARGAMRWWRELEELPDAASVIEPFLSPSGGAGRKLGRNEPCWCGSGRKFKQCHQNASDEPALPDRVAWLRRKATLWLEHAASDVRMVATEMAIARATGVADTDPWELGDYDDDELRELFAGAFDDPIVFDAALHEGGLFGLFLHERGPLLPEDEQLLAAAWRLVDRSVHEVTAVERGVGMTLRDLATGEEAEVRERTASRRAEVGERVCARVVPDGATHQIIGGVFPVGTGEEESVLDLCSEGDGAELCAWVGRMFRPPTLVHQPGLAESMFDSEALEAAVADLGEDADEGTIRARLNEEVSRQAHARWLEEQVPALGGLTPRQAAADPTRRDQLERLLDEFEERAGRLRGAADEESGFIPFTYDVPTLRRELGLD